MQKLMLRVVGEDFTEKEPSELDLEGQSDSLHGQMEEALPTRDSSFDKSSEM